MGKRERKEVGKEGKEGEEGKEGKGTGKGQDKESKAGKGADAGAGIGAGTGAGTGARTGAGAEKGGAGKGKKSKRTPTSASASAASASQEKTEEEEDLESFLFGKDILQPRKRDEVLFTLDTAPTGQEGGEGGAVWEDEEDAELQVDLGGTNRLKKLKLSLNGGGAGGGEEGVVSAGVLSDLLQERFKTRSLEWAHVEEDGLKAQKESLRMRGLDEDDVALLMQSGALAGNVRNSNINDVRNGGNTGKNGKKGKNGRFGMGAVGGAAEGVALPAGMLDIKRLSDGNIAEPSSGSISAVDFHPRGDVLMVAGADRHVRLFHVDGDRNERQASVKIQDMPVVSGFFRGNGSGGGTGYTSSEVVLAGRKPYFYCYDVQGGGMSKIPGPMGLVDAGPAAKSLEHMVQSPGGELLAFRAASGYVHYCTGASKQWVGRIKSNSAVRSLCFLDDRTLCTSGLDADVYVWDLRKTGRCVAKFAHDDGTCAASLSSYSPYSPNTNTQSSSLAYLAVGAESGVVSVFGARHNAQGYDFSSNAVFGAGAGAGVGGGMGAGMGAGGAGGVGGGVRQLKSILNLTVPVTLSAFHPSGQILAISSHQRQNQLKLVHLPSGEVFGNWPTQGTPLHKVTAMAFSRGSGGEGVGGGGYFAVGNGAGRVLLYQLKHFSSA